MNGVPDVGPAPSLPDTTEQPWVETRPGMVFFLIGAVAAPMECVNRTDVAIATNSSLLDTSAAVARAIA